MRFDVFVCYDTDTAEDIAVHLANCIEKHFKVKFFVAARHYDIPPGCPDEHEFRLKAIRECEYFVFLVTNLALDSDSVAEEVSYALNQNRPVVVCFDKDIKTVSFTEKFPELGSYQRLEKFENKNDLARKFVTFYLSLDLPRRANNIRIVHEEKTIGILLVKPSWSVDTVASNVQGHIIFNIRNLTKKKIVLYGYRMFRISPEGIKDYYYNGKICEADECKGWVFDPHFRIILYEDDEHTFQWGDVDIPVTYGIDREGAWQTEVQIAYLEEGGNVLNYSVGQTNIQYRKE